MKLPQIIALNKADLLPENSTAVADFTEFLHKQNGFESAPVFVISANQRKGVNELVTAIFEKLDTLPKPEPIKADAFDFDTRDTISVEVKKLDDGIFEVSGGRMIELARKVNIDEPDSLAYFQKRLRDDGVIAKLLELGMQDGDTVILGDIEFEYTE